VRFGRGLTVITLLLTLLHAEAASVWAMQTGPASHPVDTTTRTEASFPQGVTFSAAVPLPTSDADVDLVQLLYRIGSDSTLNLEIIAPSDFAVSVGTVEISTFVDLLSAFVPLGVDLTFHWEVMLADGTITESAEETVQWKDSRFDWEERTSEQVRLYTYGGSDEFADRMLQDSQATIDGLEAHYSLHAIPRLTIWIYPSYEDFNGTMQGNMRESIAALTYPGLDTIVGIVPDGDTNEFLRVVPHEISHQVLFAATEDAFGPPPLWFDEGLATHTQIGGTASYGDMVAKAEAEGRLFDIQSLNNSFPYQPQQATLAYASAWSMISYIETRWGQEGIARLIEAFGSGISEEDAVRSALDVSIEELNDGWKAWIAAGAPSN
jgi:hypothetical protein